MIRYRKTAGDKTILGIAISNETLAELKTRPLYFPLEQAEIPGQIGMLLLALEDDRARSLAKKKPPGVRFFVMLSQEVLDHLREGNELRHGLTSRLDLELVWVRSEKQFLEDIRKISPGARFISIPKEDE